MYRSPGSVNGPPAARPAPAPPPSALPRRVDAAALALLSLVVLVTSLYQGCVVVPAVREAGMRIQVERELRAAQDAELRARGAALSQLLDENLRRAEMLRGTLTREERRE